MKDEGLSPFHPWKSFSLLLKFHGRPVTLFHGNLTFEVNWLMDESKSPLYESHRVFGKTLEMI
jgi:hypothetical protein